MTKPEPAAGEPVTSDEVRKIGALTSDPRNARRHSEAQISQIVQSIERLGLSEAGYKALGIALNRIPENSSWDDEILRSLLTEIEEDGENALSLGFTPGEIKKLLDEPDDLEVKEIETGPVDDEFWISVRGPLAQQAKALKALQEAMKPYPGVTVEQGIINLG